MITEIACRVMEEIDSCMQKADPYIIEKMFTEMHAANRIFFFGVGRSLLAVEYFAMRLMHFGYRVHIVGDATCPAIDRGDALVVVSGDGETPTCLRMAEKCKDIGNIQVILITAAAKSSIGDFADIVLQLCCPVPGVESDVVSIQPYGSLFEEGVLYATDVILQDYFIKRLGRYNLNGTPLHANLE